MLVCPFSDCRGGYLAFCTELWKWRIKVKNYKLLRKIPAVLLAMTAIMSLTACNTEIKVSFDCNAGDYITLGQYKGIEVDVDSSAIVNGLVEERIQNDLADVTEYNSVTRGAQDNDRLTLEFTGSIGGSTVDGFSSNEYTLILGKDSFVIPGFTDELYEMKAGDKKVVTLTVPEGIADAESYANKRIVYDITMAKVEQPIIPMLTDVYAKENFGYESMEAYRQSIIDDIQETISENVNDAKKQAVLEKLQDNATISGYPEDIVNVRKEELKSSINFYSMMYGMNEDEYCKDRYGISFEEYVKKSVAQELIMQLIIKQEGLKVTEYEYKDNLDDFAKDNGYSDEQKFVETFGRDKIVRNMLIQKAVDVVMDSAVINEK